jgi:hypothetical protein
MQHSVRYIGKTYSELSELRKDKNPFKADDFFEFAKNNSKKYGLIKNGEDLLVSTWRSDSLIKDYQNILFLNQSL